MRQVCVSGNVAIWREMSPRQTGREAVTRHDDRRERDDVVGGGGGARWRGDGTIGSPSARDECDRQARCLRLPLITMRAQNGVSRRRLLTSVRRFERFPPGLSAGECE